jgi:hypothetical protein
MMKKLIRFAVVLVVVGIFAFSSNPTITKVRTFTVEKGKELFDKGVDKLEESGETGEKIADVIE